MHVEKEPVCYELFDNYPLADLGTQPYSAQPASSSGSFVITPLIIVLIVLVVAIIIAVLLKVTKSNPAQHNLNAGTIQPESEAGNGKSPNHKLALWTSIFTLPLLLFIRMISQQYTMDDNVGLYGWIIPTGIKVTMAILLVVSSIFSWYRVSAKSEPAARYDDVTKAIVIVNLIVGFVWCIFANYYDGSYFGLGHA